MMVQLIQKEVGEWHEKTFGRMPFHANRLIKKWEEESGELVDAMEAEDHETIGEELADCQILLLAIARRAGVDLAAETRKKFNTVKSRDQVARDKERGIA